MIFNANASMLKSTILLNDAMLLGVSDYSYFPASVRQVCQYNSTFTAVTFEDIDSMITSSLNKAREKTPENTSPVEQVIKF